MDITAIRIKEKDARIFSHIFWNKIPPESQALLTDRKQEKALLQSIIGQALLAYLLKKKEGIWTGEESEKIWGYIREAA